MNKFDDACIELAELDKGRSIVSARQLDLAAFVKKLRPIIGLGDRSRARSYRQKKGRKQRNDYE